MTATALQEVEGRIQPLLCKLAASAGCDGARIVALEHPLATLDAGGASLVADEAAGSSAGWLNQQHCSALGAEAPFFTPVGSINWRELELQGAAASARASALLRDARSAKTAALLRDADERFTAKREDMEIDSLKQRLEQLKQEKRERDRSRGVAH